MSSTSPKTLNSVLDGYEPPTSPHHIPLEQEGEEVEPYHVMKEERDALRIQNQQLWRIIEKQRGIIHQLQKVNTTPPPSNKGNPGGNSLSSPSLVPLAVSSSVSSSKDRMVDGGRTTKLDNGIMDSSLMAVGGGSSLVGHEELKVTSSAAPSALVLDKSLLLSGETNGHTKSRSMEEREVISPMEQEYTRAQKSQSVLSSRFHIPSPPNEPPTQQETAVSSPSNSTYDSNEEEEKEGLGPLTLSPKDQSSEPNTMEPTLHKAQSDSSLRRSNVAGTYPGVATISGSNTEEGTVKLKVPRRSSLRGRLDPTKPNPHHQQGGGAGTKAVPDLRKVASTEEKLNSPGLFAAVMSGLGEDKLISEKDKMFPTGKVQRSLSESSALISPINIHGSEVESPAKSPVRKQTIVDSALHTHLITTAFSRAVALNTLPNPHEETSDELESISTQDTESIISHHSNGSVDLIEGLRSTPPTNDSHINSNKKGTSRPRPLKMVPEEGGVQETSLEDDVYPQELVDPSLSRKSSRNRKIALMGHPYTPSPATNIIKEMSEEDRVTFLRQEFIRLMVTLRLQPSTDPNGPGVLFRITLIGHPNLPPTSDSASKEQKGEGELPPLPVELWRLDKSWDQLTSLETQLLSTLSPNHLASMSPLPPWPAPPPPPLGQGVQEFLNGIAQLPANAAGLAEDPIARFFATDLLESPALPSTNSAAPDSPPKKRMYKAGSLLKRGKKLGKLMLRYFVASSSTLEYFESNDGAYLGSINVLGAQIVRSVVASLHSELYERYVYAITIMERKKAALVKHTFFIDNQTDWDDWIAVLEYFSRNETTTGSGPRRMKSQESVSSLPPTSPTEPDPYSSSLSHTDLKTAKNIMYEFMGGKNLRKETSPPEKEPAKPAPTPAPARKAFQWNTKIFSDAFHKKNPGQHRIFGVPLEQAIAQAPIKAGYQMPSVMHRCIEYLEKHEAFLEEGIYRLSGSAADIQHLKDKFDSEGDYDLLKSGTRYDVHTVAGLLKLYLREMPTYVLTQELQPEFLKAVDLKERHLRVNELGRLVCALPLANYTLLRTLTAHLIRIVERCDVNKMTLRNIGIVFVPTLAVPAGVFNLMVAEFEYVFWVNDQGGASPKSLEGEPNPSTTQAPPSLDPPVPIDQSTSQPHLKSPIAFNFRDRRNSCMYRDVVPTELVTVEHGLNHLDTDLDYDSSENEMEEDETRSISDKVFEDSWVFSKKAYLLKQPNPRNEALLASISNPVVAVTTNGNDTKAGEEVAPPTSTKSNPEAL